MKERDSQIGLLYKIASQSTDYSQVSIKVANPCLPTEAVNKEYVDGLEQRLFDLIDSIDNGLSSEDVAKLLQPLKDAIDALKIHDDSGLAERIRQLEETVAKIIKSGVGTTTIVYQGTTLKYYNLGLGDIVYRDVILCGRTVVETQVTLALNLGNRDFTPLSLRRVAGTRKFAETLNMPCNELTEDGKIILYFQGANRYPVGDLQLVVAVEGDPMDLSPALAPPELIAEVERAIGQKFEADQTDTPDLSDDSIENTDQTEATA